MIDKLTHYLNPLDKTAQNEQLVSDLDDVQERKPVNLYVHTNHTNNLKVLIVSPAKFEDVRIYADHLKDNITVVVNLTSIDIDMQDSIKDFMNNYIDLMKLRMNNKISLTVTFPEKYEDINIPPLIFIPFIENAFKHGISYREKSFIEISMTTINKSVVFRCANSIVKNRETDESEHSGIGLENVTKRLNLLFPGKHEMKINRSDKEFEVLLQINPA